MIFLPHIAVKKLFLHKRHRRLIHRETAVLCLLDFLGNFRSTVLLVSFAPGFVSLPCITPSSAALETLFRHKISCVIRHFSGSRGSLLFGMNFLFGPIAQAYDIVFVTNNYHYADEQRNKR